MFVAWRDVRFARGRFALMGTVIVLIALLVGLLSGLTAGLAQQNVSAVTGLPADRIAFAAPAAGQQPSYADSAVTERQWRRWAGVPGVTRAEPLGITPTRATAGDRSAGVSLFGVAPGSRLVPGGARVTDTSVVLSAPAAEELGARPGDTVGLAGLRLTVAAVRGEASFSHTPVVWTSLATWRRAAPPAGAAATGGGEAEGGDGTGAGRDGTEADAAAGGGGSTPDSGSPGAGGDAGTAFATVIALTTASGTDIAAGDAAAGTSTLRRDDSLTAIGSYRSENASLQLMRGFLLVISALVIGAFFSVWTIQRSGDVAVLKALGASTGHLLKDALGQAAVLLACGILAGTGTAAALGALLSGSDVPFVLTPATVLAPAAVMTLLGTLGAALAVRRITSVDPLTALGNAR